MDCPSCNSSDTKVLWSKPDESENYLKIRRYFCPSCMNRWYAGVPHEVVLQSVAYCGGRHRHLVASDLNLTTAVLKQRQKLGVG